MVHQKEKGDDTMGITIYYAGKAKSLEAFGELLESLADRASALHWPLKAVDQDLKGKSHLTLLVS